MKKVGGLITAFTLVIALPVFGASTIEYATPPATPEEQAVAKVVEAFVEAHGGSTSALTALFTDDAVVCCLGAGFGIQPRYEGKSIPLLFGSAQVSNKSATSLAVKVDGGKAEVAGKYTYDVSNPRGRPVSRSYGGMWKLRKEADGAWKISEIAWQ